MPLIAGPERIAPGTLYWRCQAWASRLSTLVWAVRNGVKDKITVSQSIGNRAARMIR